MNHILSPFIIALYFYFVVVNFTTPISDSVSIKQKTALPEPLAADSISHEI